MKDDIQRFDDKSELFDLKIKHVELNNAELKRAMKKKLDKLDKTFLGLDMAEGIGPWGKTQKYGE